MADCTFVDRTGYAHMRLKHFSALIFLFNKMKKVIKKVNKNQLTIKGETLRQVSHLMTRPK